MRSSTIAVELVRLWAPDNLRRVAPGVALCAVIAAVAFTADTRNMLKFGAVWVPPLILTLVIGMALQPLSARPALKPGLEFAGRTLLRVGVALYGALLGLLQQDPERFLQGGLVLDVQALIDERNAAKLAKNFARADEIRKHLESKGIVLEDKPGGVTEWRKK